MGWGPEALGDELVEEAVRDGGGEGARLELADERLADGVGEVLHDRPHVVEHVVGELVEPADQDEAGHEFGVGSGEALDDEGAHRVPDEHRRGDVEVIDELADVGGEVVGCVAVGRGVGAAEAAQRDADRRGGGRQGVEHRLEGAPRVGPAVDEHDGDGAVGAAGGVAELVAAWPRSGRAR